MLDDRGTDPEWLAKEIGQDEDVVFGILKGETPITAPIAAGLQRVLGVSAVFWVRLETNYRREISRGSRTTSD